MSRLAEVVQGLAARDGVEAALLLSRDGLPIEHAAGEVFEAETVAALSATVAHHATRLGEGIGSGDFRLGVLEYGERLVVLAAVGEGDWLALLTRPSADIGPVLYDLRHHLPALSALL